MNLINHRREKGMKIWTATPYQIFMRERPIYFSDLYDPVGL